MCEREQLLHQIQALDFALYDLQLYLDTHPTCPHARQQYRKYLARKKTAAEQYIRLYGPITAEQADALDEHHWSWVQNPWPWEKEGN